MLHRVLPWLWRLADEHAARPVVPAELQQQLLEALMCCPVADDTKVWHSCVVQTWASLGAPSDHQRAVNLPSQVQLRIPLLVDTLKTEWLAGGSA
jgi:hypothetical protein